MSHGGIRSSGRPNLTTDDEFDLTPLQESVVRAVAALTNPRFELVVVRAIEYEADRESGGLVASDGRRTYREHEDDVRAAVDALRLAGVLTTDADGECLALDAAPAALDGAADADRAGDRPAGP
ncbi:MAG: hypothetical protein ABEJ31_03050 [Haloarculaceae archaeon]